MLRRRVNSYEKPTDGLYKCFSEDSIIYPENKFSNWFGDLALVYTTTSTDRVVDASKFDPKRMARRYTVRRVVYKDKKSVMRASDYWVGEKPIIQGDKFTAGRQLNGKRELEGFFVKAEDYWVRQRVGELYPTEVALVVEYLDSRQILDVSNEFDLTAGEWYKILRRSYMEIQDLMPHKIEVINRIIAQRFEHLEPEVAWEEIKRRGVYCLTKKRDIIKFVDSRQIDKRSGCDGRRGRNSLYCSV